MHARKPDPKITKKKEKTIKNTLPGVTGTSSFMGGLEPLPPLSLSPFPLPTHPCLPAVYTETTSDSLPSPDLFP